MLLFQAKAKVQIKVPSDQSTLQFSPYLQRDPLSLLLCFTAYFFQHKDQYQRVSLVYREEVLVLVAAAVHHCDCVYYFTHSLIEKEFRESYRGP